MRILWPALAGLAALLSLAFYVGHSGLLQPQSSQRVGDAFHRISLGRELKDSVLSDPTCAQGPVISAASSGVAAFSSPNEKETLFRVTPGGRPFNVKPGQACPVVTILSIVRDASSWGEGDRSIADYLQVIQAIAQEGPTLDLAISIESKQEFDSTVCTLSHLYKLGSPSGIKCPPLPPSLPLNPVPLSGIQVFHVPTLRGYPEPSMLTSVPRDQRGLHPAQKARRRWLARNRNRLAWGAAKDQAAFLWLDTDIAQLPQGMLTAMLDSDKDIIVPVVRCNCSWGNDYFDKNTWIGPIQPGFSETERHRFRGGDEDWPGFKKLHEWGGRWGPDLHYLDNPRYNDKPLVPVDSVGGAVLFVRPEVFQQGANFGIANMVGTDWESEGWDSIETEALCWMATKAGFSCWGMPQQIAWHVPCKY